MEKMQEMNKLYKDISNKEYQKNKNFVSSSTLKQVLKSPRLINAEKKETESMNFGTLIHTLVLEPENFDKEYLIFDESKRPEPDKDYRTKVNSEWKKSIESDAINSNKILLPSEQNEKAKYIVDSVKSHKIASQLLSGGMSEVTATYQDKETGVWCKIRPDYLPPVKNTIVDLKTCQESSLDAIQRSIYKYGYHISAGMYLDGMSIVTKSKFTDFILIFVETSYPYNVTVVKLDERTILYGQELYKKALNKYKYCLANGFNEGYAPEELIEIGLPEYAFYKDEAVA